MSEKNKNEFEFFYDKVVDDEMQRALSYDLEHKSLWLWYILNSIAMLFLMVFISSEETKVPPSVQVIILAQHCIMFLCLSLYNIRAAKKGVLDSFSQYQHGMNGLKYAVGGFNYVVPLVPIVIFVMDKIMDKNISENSGRDLPFFIVWFIMGLAYEIISWYCVKQNKKVRDSLAADDEETEEE